ncbi:unnamed protein product [Calypogeia fissa]
MSSDKFIQREAMKMKKSETLTTTVPFIGIWKCILQLLLTVLTLFRYLLAPLPLWGRRVPLGFRDALGSKKGLKTLMSSGSLISPEKVEFLTKYGHEYGFSEGPVSIDQLRSEEFARLGGKVYLDHAGAALYTETQIKGSLSDLSSNLYGNPHSQSESSTLSSDIVELARNQVLAMCKASPEEYSCVFTSGATAALNLVGQTFPWSFGSQYMYTMENHNSVVGIREYALNKGATVTPVYLDHIRGKYSTGEQISYFHVREQNPLRRNVMMVVPDGDIHDDEQQAYHLFAFPLECNFSGAKVDLDLIPFVQGEHLKGPKKGGKWLVLLDAAKGCSTAPPNLSRFPADFVAISFYKIFGYPTGLGALLVRKDAAKLMKKQYFGGGTVAVALADDDFMQRRSRIEHWLEDGTVSFLGIAALCHGFRVIDRLQMSAINRHVGSLASYMASKIRDLKHYNMASVCVLYGNHGMFAGNYVKYWGKHCEQGPIVTFNMKRADGSWVGPREVEKLATLSGIHLRTGCFCNPGACSKYLGLSKHEMKENFEAGHVCWDDKDLINGYPTGAVRVSFGYMNTFEDCWAFIQFISKFFVEQDPVVMAKRQREDEASLHFARSLNGSTNNINTEDAVASLQCIMVYPIKSCRGFERNSWPIGDYGLMYDREWLLMSGSGEILTQKKCPKLCFIETYINLELGSLIVQAPNMKAALNIPLLESANDGGLKSSEWFTAVLGESCRLIRKKANKFGIAGNSTVAPGMVGVNVTSPAEVERSFANEGQFLLVSQASVEDLNRRLSSSSRSKADVQKQTLIRGQLRNQVDALRFRPNLVVSGSIPYDEDNWQSVRIGDHQFQVIRGCNRCNMINIDQMTGKLPTSGEPLVTLASYRRVKGQIYFGILIEQVRPGLEQGAAKKNGQCEVFVRRVGSRVLQVGQRLDVVSAESAAMKVMEGSAACILARKTGLTSS